MCFVGISFFWCWPIYQACMRILPHKYPASMIKITSLLEVFFCHRTVKCLLLHSFPAYFYLSSFNWEFSIYSYAVNENASNNDESCSRVFSKIDFKESFRGKKWNGHRCPIDLPLSPASQQGHTTSTRSCVLQRVGARSKWKQHNRSKKLKRASRSAASCGAQARNVAVLIRDVCDVSG